MFHWRLSPLLLFLYAVSGILGQRSCPPDHHHPPGPHCTYPSLINATAEELRNGLDHGCFTSVDLVNAYVDRINEVNSTLRMVLEINPDALDIARHLDDERRHGRIRGPLHGQVILLKEMIGTADKMSSSIGSYAFIDAKIPEDSTVAANLRRNGVVILGKTSLTEWAGVRSTNGSAGWNAQGGQTYAAYHKHQFPSGSSSGSAVSADLGLALAALGTETSGSILDPGSVNNVIGLKPTVGLTSRHMVVPISHRQDTIGPLARTVKDAARVLQAIAGPDPKDNYTLASPYGRHLPDYVAACKLSGLQGKRIGVARNVIATSMSQPQQQPLIDAFNDALEVMSTAGATIVEGTNFTAYDEILKHILQVQIVAAIDFKDELPQWISKLVTNPNHLYDLADVRNFTWHEPLEKYPYYNTAIWDQILATNLNNTSPQFWNLYQQNLYYGGKGGILGALSRHNLDAVVLPTDVAPLVPAVVGTPGITVPLGAMPEDYPVMTTQDGLVYTAPGIPFGMTFLGDKWSEETLLGMVYAYEQRTQTRQKLDHYIVPETELVDVI